MKIADFVIVAVVIIALVTALWYNHRNKNQKSNNCDCDFDCFSCSQNCGLNKKKRGNNNED